MKDRVDPAKEIINRREMLKVTGLTAAAVGLFGHRAMAGEGAIKTDSSRPRKKIKISFIGGGSQSWAPMIIRDIVCKPELQNVEIEFALLEIHMGRAQAIHNLFRATFREWGMDDRVSTFPTLDPGEGLSGADFIIIAISTGRLEAMSYDLSIPEKYSIYQPVGDTCGPGGWARNLRNFHVFHEYAKLIKQLAPNAVVLNYTNPLAALTKILANVLGDHRVVGLCHGLFENYTFLRRIFNLEREEQIKVRFGGMNHFFWIMDLKINGEDGYPLLEEKLKALHKLPESEPDIMGYISNRVLMMELYNNYNLLPYVGDRHTCEFFGCYITSTQMMERFKLVRTFISEREAGYERAARNIHNWTNNPGGLSNRPSREAAADMINAVIFDEPYTDVVNVVNHGQISNLTMGAVVETLGIVDSQGFIPITAGPLPDKVRAVSLPHADIMLRLVNAWYEGDVDEALMVLAADPACAHLTVSDSKKMGIELLEAHKKHMPDFYKS